MKKNIAVFLVLACILSLTSFAAAEEQNKFEKLINDFDGESISKVEKTLGTEYIQYHTGISYEYIKHEKTNYYEIRFFYDGENTDSIKDINFIVDYSSNKEDVEDLIWAFSRKFGAPSEKNEKNHAGDAYTRYSYFDSDGNTIALVKTYDKVAEVDYYYTGYLTGTELNYHELNAQFDLMDIMRSSTKESTIKNDSSSISLDFGDVWNLFSELDGETTSTKFIFDKNTRTLRRAYLSYPYTAYGLSQGADAMGRMRWEWDVQGVSDELCKLYGLPTAKKETYSNNYTWNAENGTYTISVYSNSADFSFSAK